MTKYYTLLSRTFGTDWSIEFGDYERQCVQDQMNDLEMESLLEELIHYRIIVTDHDQVSIDLAVEQCNILLRRNSNV